MSKAVIDERAGADEPGEIGGKIEMSLRFYRGRCRSEDGLSLGERLDEFRAALGDQARLDHGPRPDDKSVFAAGGEIDRRRDAVGDIHAPNRDGRKGRADDAR